jgi:protein involved in polysaccharide export with SLBB domain
MKNRIFIFFLGIVLLRGAGCAQETSASEGTLNSALSSYILGPADQLTVFVADLEDFDDRQVRVDTRGDVNLPVVGRIHAGGLHQTASKRKLKSG